MCPSYRVTRDEKHSTHHRASTLKAALNGEYGPQPFAGPELQAAMELCVSCKGCKSECPNGVDMAQLRIETLAQRWKTLGGVPLRERMFAYTPRYAMHLKQLNWMNSVRQRIPLIAKAMERWLGIAAKRSLPKAAARNFLSSVPQAIQVPQNAREVVLLVDTFSNHLDPQIAQAALEVLQAAGYTVHIAQPAAGERPLCCGRTFLSNGLMDEARAEATRLLDALTPFAERKLPVIGLEPSCLLMLRDEYHAMGLGDRVTTLAKSAMLLEEFLAREHAAKRLELPLKPMAKKNWFTATVTKKPSVRWKPCARYWLWCRNCRLSLSSRAAAAWPAHLAWKPNTTTCRCRWANWPCCRKCAPRTRKRC
jgi:hypothetical protein